MPSFWPMEDNTRVSSSTHVSARPEVVYGLVSDLPRMGEFSPENVGGQWLGSATGPAKGARFKGRNVQGSKKWAVGVTVTDATEPSRFAFVTNLGPKVFAEWIYEIAPAGEGGCQVTETWVDNRGPMVKALGKVMTGVDDRAEHTRSMIETTLARLKQTAEASG